LTLRAGDLVLELAPEVGGSIAAFYQQCGQDRFDWLRPASAQALQNRQPEGMASFPLVPFCNRIRNGRATFEGHAITLPPNRGASPHTIHGVGWQLPWTVETCEGQSATLTLDCPASFWPYRFFARQRFELFEDRLGVTMEVKNCDTMTMPLGVGHHPYLWQRAHAFLQTDVERMWVTDADVLPVRLEEAPIVQQLCRGVVLSDVVVDNVFTGWNHCTRVVWPGAGHRGQDAHLTLRAEHPLNYLVVYVPPGNDYFCIEPVSNCSDWLNLLNALPNDVLHNGAPHNVLSRAAPQALPDVVGGAALRSGHTYHAAFSMFTGMN
jgi:aldose 1-epimerase